VLLFWTVLAVLNLGAAVVISSRRQRIADLEAIMTLGRAWLLTGENVYRSVDSVVAHPPNAIPVLSLLSLLPVIFAAAFWLLLNIGAACVAPYFAARSFRPNDPFRVIVLPILMFLCWGGVRSLTQISLLVLTFTMAAFVFADRRPSGASGWLGLGMIQPAMALPVFLWAIFTRRWRLVAGSVLVTGGLFVVYCARIPESPAWVLARYLGILSVQYSANAIPAGLTELGPLIRQLVPNASDVNVIAGSLALGLLAGICVAGFLEGSPGKRVLYAAPPLIACWSLLTFSHVTDGFVILLPVMMLLALNDTARSTLRKALFWFLQIGMMVDIPGLSRRFAGDTPLYANVLVHADRVLILMLFVGLVVLAWKEPPATGAT
jgi:hypothetical protein